MKILIIGGTGLIGSKTTAILRKGDHEVVAASPKSGINTVTGAGLKEAMAGAQVVVDLANSPSFEDKAVLEFFETSGRNLLAAEAAAGVRSVPTMDSATWCGTPAAASAARRLRPEVSKNSSTALSSNEGELARSITTCAPAMASLSPSPVMVLTPLLGEAATTSWPPRRMATVFEPIRPVLPMTTIFMVYRPLPTTGAS